MSAIINPLFAKQTPYSFEIHFPVPPNATYMILEHPHRKDVGDSMAFHNLTLIFLYAEQEKENGIIGKFKVPDSFDSTRPDYTIVDWVEGGNSLYIRFRAKGSNERDLSVRKRRKDRAYYSLKTRTCR